MSTLSPKSQPYLEERQIVGFFVAIGTLLLFLAFTICFNKIYEGYSRHNEQTGRVFCQSSQLHHVQGCNMYLAKVIIQPARGVLPDYQTVIRMEEEQLSTYMEATNTDID
eukprot:GFUD01023057.1.p1 GENE.GFUD01023057.1~~GFUD01023057.1.p1  ORF type:complete len:110 (+),score=12.85 GFUD01023057.1:70-399(+)